LLAGLSLGVGLAILSVALNGFTDDLLFNIPSSMFLWMLAALAAAVAAVNAGNEEISEEE
jgi:putative inorganic carbon (HCO3(-)) transporter